MARRSRTKRRHEFPSEHVDQAILLACHGTVRESLPARICDHLGVDQAAALALAKLAREIIASAAGVNIDEEVGVAVLRLGKIFDTARINGDGRLQLFVLKELHKVLGLHAPPRVEVPPEPAVTPLERAVSSYLAPLGLLPGDAPPVELVRVAAQNLIDMVPLDQGPQPARPHSQTAP